jgi:predicted nucleic acid-binding protein
MTFPEIPAGASVFVDANTLVYHFVPEPGLGPACRGLLERFARQELAGFTSAHVVSNVVHRIMTLEAIDRFGWPAAGIGRRLLRHPDNLRQLTRFRQIVEEIPGFGIRVLPITMPLVCAAAAISQQHGLLSGDALVVAVMREHGIVNLASHDADFDRVPGLTRYAPASITGG